MADPVQVTNVGWTWTATVGAIQTIVTVLIGGGGLYGLAKGVALLWQQVNNRANQDNQRDAAIRQEMMELSARQNTRIEKLEDDLREERRRCDEEMGVLRREHISELAALREEIRGLQAQLIQAQQSTGRALRLGVNAPTAMNKAPDTAGIGEVLRSAYDIPEGDK